jgi:predicted PurR-regulated permease PerM
MGVTNMEQIETLTVEEAPSVTRARQAWRRVLTAVRSITPARLVRIILVVGAITAVIWLSWATWPALLPFVIGAAVAYAVLPFTNWLDRALPRVFAVAISLLVVLLIVGLFIYASVTILGRQAYMLYGTLPTQNQVDEFVNGLDDQLSSLSPPLRAIITQVVEKLLSQVRIDAEAYNDRIVNLIFNGLFGLLNAAGFILGFLAIPAWLLLVLRDQQSGARALQRLLPRHWLPDVWAVWRIFDRSFRAFMQGLLVLALFVTIFIYMGLVFFELVGMVDVTFKFAAATFAGLMQLIPTIGPIIVVCVILLSGVTMMSTTEVLLLLALYLAVQQLLRLTAEPRVRKRVAADIHPALLIMVIVALSQFGFLWVFLAAPVATIVRDLFVYVYGRFLEPPRTAGLLPGETLPKRRQVQSVGRPVPLAYRHGRAARSNGRDLT